MKVEKRRADAVRADAVIAALARLWPDCFSILWSSRRPLAIGIHEELRRQLEPMIRAGCLSERDIAIGLRRYASNSCYLYACSREDALRIGLNGEPCGTVNAEQVARAQRLLDRVRRRRIVRAAATQRIAEQTAASALGLSEGARA